MRTIALIMLSILFASCQSGLTIEERAKRSTARSNIIVESPQLARDTSRRADVQAILNALYQYSVENLGEYPEGIPAILTEICKPGAECRNLVDLSMLEGEYLSSLPVDSLTSSPNGIGYAVMLKDGHITVAAPKTEASAMINLTK